MATGDKHIFALHKYFIWSDRMRAHFENVLLNKSGIDKVSEETELLLYMSYWYGGLFVVIEGWIALGLTDSRIDNLLKSPNVDLLKRYRNGTFHFQKNYFDERFVGFIRADDSAAWVRELRDAFSDFFFAWLDSKES